MHISKERLVPTVEDCNRYKIDKLNFTIENVMTLLWIDIRLWSFDVKCVSVIANISKISSKFFKIQQEIGSHNFFQYQNIY